MNEITLSDDVRMRHGIIKRRPETVESIENTQQRENFNRSVFDGLQVGQFWHEE